MKFIKRVFDVDLWKAISSDLGCTVYTCIRQSVAMETYPRGRERYWWPPLTPHPMTFPWRGTVAMRRALIGRTCGRTRLRWGRWSSRWSTWRCSPRRASGGPRSGSWGGSPRCARGSCATPRRRSSPASPDAVTRRWHFSIPNIDFVLYCVCSAAVFISSACPHTHLAGQQDRVLVQAQHGFRLYGNVGLEPTGGLGAETQEWVDRVALNQSERLETSEARWIFTQNE